QPDVEEKTMDQPTPTLFAGRYELPGDDLAGTIRVTDTAPWRRCWACGSTTNEPGDAFCNDCGAALEPRVYSATLTPRDTPAGAALVPTIDDEVARATLPEVAEQVEDGDRVLTILHDSGRAALAIPLDETAALAAGASLARLVAHLHGEGLALGPVEADELEAVPGGGARLRAVDNLRRFGPGEREAAVQSDLTALAELLEQLTATPRTTQRLSEDEAALAIAEGEPGLATVLRQVRTGELADAAALAVQLEAILAERTHPVALRQQVGAQTDTGIVRDHNEDSYLTIQLGLDNDNTPQSWGVYIVSDGMGGHAAGEVASGLAIRAAADLILSEYLARAVQPDASYSEAEAKDVVRRAILAANERVAEESRRQGNDMGATFTMALVIGDRVIVGNIGDSRTYLYQGGKLRRISKDHSLVQRLVDLGQIADEDIYTHPQRNAVLRSLGDRGVIEVDLFSERVRAGESLLLCSDGQWEMTRDPAMELLIAREPDPQAVCATLIAAANQAGGEDNITAVLVRFL
ncbi:MAG: protein phosphatase, partial [Chloroflexales bacterium]|nr:protein phosphatase [Chloroflexales bacterium]